MLSEGSAVLLSRHGASLASKPESFGFGRTFTDMTACPLTGHANSPAFSIGRHQLFGGIRCRACGQTPGFFHILGVDTDNGAYLIAISRNKSVRSEEHTSRHSTFAEGRACLTFGRGHGDI